MALPPAEKHHPKRYLFIASTGGHLTELLRLSDVWPASAESLWITFDSEQSRSLLADRRVLFVPYVRPRDILGVLRTIRLTAEAVRSGGFDLAVTTGAAVALGVLPVTKALRVPSGYIESVSRVDGPSLTGRLIRLFRLATTYTQHPSWSSKAWREHPSVLTHFRSVEALSPRVPEEPLKIFVTLGTIAPYRFDALIDSVLQTGLANGDTVWQLGCTDRVGLPGTTLSIVSSTEFDRRARDADVVITHAGVGTILTLLDLGVHPVVVPRRRGRGEHVDNHQVQIAHLLRDRRVSTVVEAPDLTAEVLEDAARLGTRSDLTVE